MDALRGPGLVLAGEGTLALIGFDGAGGESALIGYARFDALIRAHERCFLAEHGRITPIPEPRARALYGLYRSRTRLVRA